MKLIELKCPSCGANLENIDPSLNSIFCMYCGSKIAITDENHKTIEYVHREIDEAKIKKSELAQQIFSALFRQPTKEEQKENFKQSIFYSILAIIILFMSFGSLIILSITLSHYYETFFF